MIAFGTEVVELKSEFAFGSILVKQFKSNVAMLHSSVKLMSNSGEPNKTPFSFRLLYPAG